MIEMITVSAVSSHSRGESPCLRTVPTCPVVLDAGVARHFPER
jgi:hypothetical protein